VDEISNKNGHTTAFETPGVMHCSLWKIVREIAVEILSAFKVLSCLVCNCCRLTVFIVLVVLCALLSYVYLLYYVGIAVFLL